MHIISGEKKGTKLSDFKGVLIRPTSQRIKEAIFNILENSKFAIKIKDKVVFDLFAGSGALGLEALSRGSKKVYFFEKEKKSIKLIEKNINKLNYSKKSLIIENDVNEINDSYNEKADILFCDPPYNSKLCDTTLINFEKKNVLMPGCIIILETKKNENVCLNTNFEYLDTRIYGKTKISFLKFKE